MKKIDKEELHTIFCKIETDKELYFNKLYENYRGLIYAIAFSILKNREDSEDVVQKVYIKIWNMENQKLPKNNEASWLYSITKNEAIDFIRNRKSSLNIDEIYYISEDDELNEIIDRDNYNKIIEKLNPDEQEIVSLKILSNLSFKEISQMLNIPESTAKWKYYKSMHTLKLLLGNLGMFILTFTICLKAVLNQTKSSDIENEVQEDSDTSSSSSQQQTTHDGIGDQELTMNNSTQNTTEQVVETPSTNNYYKIGIFGVSSVFLILTIIFSIILTKHQLNKKHKSSK